MKTVMALEWVSPFGCCDSYLTCFELNNLLINTARVPTLQPYVLFFIPLNKDFQLLNKAIA